MADPTLIERFSNNARSVSAEVFLVDSMASALDHAVAACRDKAACQVLASGCEHPLSDPARELCGLKEFQKLIAAPDLSAGEMEALTGRCREAGIGLIDRGLHAYTGGIDVGLTHAAAGVAETGTLVLEATSEDLRLATMISEVHIAMIHAEAIQAEAGMLEEMMKNRFSGSPDFTAFITGPSRTADIERVLSLGVHGPLALHILILTGEED